MKQEKLQVRTSMHMIYYCLCIDLDHSFSFYSHESHIYVQQKGAVNFEPRKEQNGIEAIYGGENKSKRKKGGRRIKVENSNFLVFH